METVPMWVWMLDDAVAAWGRELERGGGAELKLDPGGTALEQRQVVDDGKGARVSEGGEVEGEGELLAPSGGWLLCGRSKVQRPVKPWRRRFEQP